MPEITFSSLPGSSDNRGLSFSLLSDVLGLMPAVRDVHIASVRPGSVRGNHYHAMKTEVITVVYTDAWSFYWDSGEGTEVQRRQFTGTGAVAVAVPLHWSHAVKNDGRTDLWLFNASDLAFVPGPGASTDSHAREVVR